MKPDKWEGYVVIRKVIVEAQAPPHGQVQMVERPYGLGQMPTVYAEVRFAPVCLKDTGDRKTVRI